MSPVTEACPSCGGWRDAGSGGRYCPACYESAGATPPAEPDPWAITADTLERLEPLVTMHTGLRAKFLAEGFSSDAADALTVEAARVLTAQMELRARTTAAKREARLAVRGNGYLTNAQAEAMLARIEHEAARND